MPGPRCSSSVLASVALALAAAAAPACSPPETPLPAPPPGHPLTQAELTLRARLGVPEGAKQVIVFGQNAHMDIDWQMTFDDYYTTFVGQLLTEARQILQQQPRAFYAVAEMAYLQNHLTMHPEELAPLLAASRAGSLHIVGGGMTSPDTLLPETELLLRDYLYGIQFAEDTLDAHPTAAWLPDSFGHAGTAPDVLAAAGFQSVAFARVDGAPTLFEELFKGDPPPKEGSVALLLQKLGSADFVWVGPGGGEVLAHFMASKGLYCAGDNIDYAEGLEVAGGHTGDFMGDDPTYTDGQIDAYIAGMAPYTATPYIFIPVGCDFAHPKPQLIEYLDGYNERRYPTTGVWAVAAPFDLYADLVSPWRDVIPRISGDLSPYYMGFYGSRAAVKRGIRDAARPFFMAETFATTLGADGQAMTLAAAPALTLLTRADHHDFVPGTSTDSVVANEEMPLLAQAQAAGQAELGQVAAAIAMRVPVQTGAVARVLALNGAGVAQSDVAELTLPITAGMVPPLHALADGQPVPLEVVGTPLPTDTTATLRLGLTGLAPFSWRAIDLLPGASTVTPAVTLALEDAKGAPATGAAVTRVVLSNASVKATWNDLGKGGFALTSLLLGGVEALAGASGRVHDYEDMGGLWRLGNEMNGCSLTPLDEAPASETVEVLDATGLEARVVFHGATADREAALGAGATGLSFAITTGAATSTTRTVSFSLAVPETALLTTSEPAGSEQHPWERVYTPTFWAAVGWAQVGGLGIFLRQSTGVRMSTPGQIELMAVRDAQTEQCDVEGGTGSDTGIHRIEWLLAPAANAVAAEAAAQAWNRPIDLEVVPLAQAPTLDLPRAEQLLGVTGAGVVSALKPADRGDGVILRALLMPGPVTVTLPPALVGKQMTQVDVAERDGASLGVAGKTVVFDQATFGAVASVRLH
jgi:hypothetical protein